MVKLNKPRKPQTLLDQLPIEARLKIKKYSSDACNAAIHGQQIPVALGYELHRFSVIHGIRHHHGFAQELHGVAPEFTRALNARDIMSGIIPAKSEPDEIPYCIWHPEVPDESTLRALVQRYPQMLYNAARACAVAGYIDLYEELNPLPEVHVAEEEASYASAEKSNKGSQEIHQRITSQHLKFEIMNDNTRTVDIANPRVASLNGDTAFYSSLGGGKEHVEQKELKYFYREYGDFHCTSHYFNITEDWGIDDHDHEAPDAPESYFPLLYGPLPMDLPPVNKDKLIVMAAYSGDIDRYTRLHRPQMVSQEYFCIIRGIYHNSFWAKWWSTQITEDANTTRFSEFEIEQIQRAINARRIMSDDVTWVTADTPEDLLPMNIWFPKRACADTYERLARIRPDMLWVCLHACIVADYPETWDKLLVLFSSAKPAGIQMAPTESETQEWKLQHLSRIVGPQMWMEANASRNDHYRRDIAAAVPDKLESLDRDYIARTLFGMISKEWHFPTPHWVDKWVDKNDPVHVGLRDYGEYDGVSVRVIPSIDFAVFARDAIGVDHDIWKNKKDGRLMMFEVYELLEAAEASHRSVARI